MKECNESSGLTELKALIEFPSASLMKKMNPELDSVTFSANPVMETDVSFPNSGNSTMIRITEIARTEYLSMMDRYSNGMININYYN